MVWISCLLICSHRGLWPSDPKSFQRENRGVFMAKTYRVAVIGRTGKGS
jgi:hypothetical protein